MASTYSSNLKIELIGTGEQSGTWGSTTNTNLGTALEEAIVGRATANFATDADLTLTLTNSNATQVARAFVLNVTSTGSLTATRNLIVPTVNKPYLIQNNTTGGQSIVVKTSSGTGYTVPNGKKAYVYTDGTNVVAAIDHLGALTLTDTLQVNGYMGVGGAANSSQGLRVVPSALTGTTQFGSALSLTATSAATAGVEAVRAQAGTAAAAFTTGYAAGLWVRDAILGAGSTITSNYGICVDDKTVGTNNYGITSLVSSGTNKWNIYASGTAANYFAGNVGIGDTNPGVRLSTIFSNSGVYASSSASLNTPAGTEHIFSNTSNTSGAGTFLSLRAVTSNGTVNYGYIGATSTNGSFSPSIVFGQRTGLTSYEERFKLASTEAVFNDPGNGYDFRIESDTGTHAFFLEGSSGNVGIGASSPATALQIVRANTTAGLGNGGLLTLENTSGSAFNQRAEILFKNVGQITSAISSSYTSFSSPEYAGDLIFATKNTTDAAIQERMRIDRAGNVGIGSSPAVGLHLLSATTPVTGSAQRYNVFINDSTALAAGIGGGIVFSGVVDGTTAQVGFGGIQGIKENATSGNNASALIFTTRPYGGNLTERLRIGSSGNVGIGDTTPDKRLVVYDATDPDVLVLSHATSTTNTQGATLLFRNESSSGTLSGAAIGYETGSAVDRGSLVFKTSATSNAPTEHLRITSSGNVGIGTDAPAAKLAVVGGDLHLGETGQTAGSRNFRIWRGDSTTQYANFSATAGAATIDMVNGSGGGLIVKGDGTERARITSDGYLRLASGSLGIQFNGDTAAANALDDYEQGTFTPTIVGSTTAGTGTYTAQVGRYTKIGNRVYFSVAIGWSAHTGTGNMRIGALPFTSANVTAGFGFLAVGASNLTYPAQLTAYVESNSTQCSFATFATGAALSPLAIDTAATVYVSGHYEV